MTETAFLRRAIELAVHNASTGQLPFGALVVRDGDIVGTGVNTELRDLDPTGHAEVGAVRNACRELGTLTLPGALLVSSCEPCALCHTTAALAGISRVVYAAPKELAAAMLGAAEDPEPRLLTQMQRALRALAPEQVVHGPTDGDSLPFERYATARLQP
ncbi:MAG TPA: nucleoside deaminase [Acidimicrobiales bacterium]